MSEALAPIGSQAKQAYNNVMSFFTDSVAREQSISDAQQSAKNFADGMKKQVDQIMVDIGYTINEASDGVAKIKTTIGANVAVGIIGEITSDVSAIAQDELKGTFDASKKFFQKSLDKVAKEYENDRMIPPDVTKKMLQSIKDIDAGFQEKTSKNKGWKAFVSNVRETRMQLERAVDNAVNSQKYQRAEQREQIRQRMVKSINAIDYGFSEEKKKQDIRAERVKRIQQNVINLLREAFKDTPVPLEVQQEAIKSVQQSAKEITAKSQKAYRDSMDMLLIPKDVRQKMLNSIDDINARF